MPRRRIPRPDEPEPLDRDRIVGGVRRTESRLGFDWNVQHISQSAAVKEYRCPGCAGVIRPQTAHLVVWRADSLFGDRAIDDRRHWHAGCWRAA